MPDFKIDVTRTGYAFATIPVKEAKNVVEAEELALDRAGDHTFTETSSDYSLTNGSSAPDEFEGMSSRLLVIGAINPFEFSPLPSWAELTVDPELLRKLRRLSEACEELKAESLCVIGAELNAIPEWGPANVGYDLGMARFEISNEAFWLSVPVKYLDQSMTTVEVDLKTLLKMMKEQPEGPLFFAGYPDMLKAEYEERALAATMEGIEVEQAGPVG